ncbi:UDP-4-amino-4,6-dideoxy-N-acetyl-beta-L-altrosamine N-acetyltransferase [Helicobacter sp. MIT 21-1697]|uniref:UDP-4-amino-4, 6-dideoxy-N-acetyl-beta-L-altrosamine N-acetyltransferase n=1 Tax=Helicobacter sp. MIT 21-1697 TaxID=2993733 RepID=UPI00224A91CF|nr:UDP-4-amino-4,6-dideoxy-N-acetyl-beta-L-altrosamine N-acetyltransferase [Helicobacter sp. MIT 21-1697]MCX2716895.1 UDP-4-amino-4,6-dideoxy-N-acetyl-beta-L-altrosamine N-acetyltransferase [Helicobacter sp. MIT 21-1697]
MRIDIFCESGSAYGLGHFYRCLKLIALCGRIPQVDSITLHNRGDFVPPALETLLPPLQIHIESKNYEWLSTQPQMLDVAIVDSYEAQEWFYHRLDNQSKALICLDDAFRDVYPPTSYILNPAPNAKEAFPQNEQFWCGEEYLILPFACADSKPQCEHKNTNELKDVFVTFGGVDKDNLVQNFVDSLSTLILTHPHLKQKRFHIILGGGYTHTLHLPQNLQDSSNPLICIYRNLNPYDFLTKAQQCDIAISAGGGTMLELLALKVPCIIIEAASNQHLQITQWAQKGAILQAKNPKDSLTHLIRLVPKDMLSIHNTLNSLSLGSKLPLALYNLINTLAAQDSLIADSHNQTLVTKDFTQLTQEECELVLKMRNHPQIAQWMYSEHISSQAHFDFIEKLKNDTSRRYWLCYEANECIGVGSLTRINLSHKHAFIGIYTNPNCAKAFKGRTILRFLESQAFEHLALHTLHLEVLSHNSKARNFYERMGYVYEGVLRDFIAQKDKGQRRYYDVILMYKERK